MYSLFLYVENGADAGRELLDALERAFTVVAAETLPVTVGLSSPRDAADAFLLLQESAVPAAVGLLRDLLGNPPPPIVVLADAWTPATRALAHAEGAVACLDRGAPEVAVTSALRRVCERGRRERERRVSLEDARRLRHLFEQMLTSVGDGIMAIDTAGKIRFQNPQAEKILGETDDEVTGETDYHLRHMAVVPVVQALTESLTDGRRITKNVELGEDVDRLVLEIRTFPMRDHEGHVTGAVAVFRDRSAEMMLEERLVHCERLATIGSLLASVAHEIMTPLTSVTGSSELGREILTELDEALRGSEIGARPVVVECSRDLGEILSQVHDAGRRCQGIAEQILEYSRRRRSPEQPEDLNLLVRGTLDSMGKYLGTGRVQVRLDLNATQPVLVEKAQIQQALINLVSNAVAAMAEDENALLHLETGEEEEFTFLRVSDNGPGIPAASLERIWNPFYTTKEKGTGLGLYIVRKVVENQGGRIEVGRAPEGGTAFTIRIPNGSSP